MRNAASNKRRFASATLLVLVALAIFFGWRFARTSEPVFEERRFTEWLLDLNSPDEPTRQRALKAMNAFGRPGVPHLIAALRRRDRRWKTPLAALATALPPRASIRVHQMIGVGREYEVRHAAAVALQNLGPQAEDAAPALAHALEHEADMISWRASMALAAIGPAAVTHLIPLLKSNSEVAFRRACDALAALGGQAEAAVPVLVESLGQVTVWAALVTRALGNIGAPAVPRLIAALDHSDYQTRQYAARALALIGPPAREAFPKLIVLLQDSNVKMRQRAVEALGNIRPSAPETVAALASALNDREAEVRLQALRAFSRSAGAAARAQESLRRALEDENAEVREEAARLLRENWSKHFAF